MNPRAINYVIRPFHFLPKHPYPGLVFPLVFDHITQRQDRVWKEEMKLTRFKTTSPESSREISKARLLKHWADEVRVDPLTGKIFFSRELASLKKHGKSFLKLLNEEPRTPLPIGFIFRNGKWASADSIIPRLQLSIRKPRASKPHVLGIWDCQKDSEIFQKVDVDGFKVYKLAQMVKSGEWRPRRIDDERHERLKLMSLKKLHETLMKQRKQFLTALMYIYESNFEFDFTPIHASPNTALPDLLRNPEVIAFGKKQLQRLEECSIKTTVSNLRLTPEAYFRKYSQLAPRDVMTEFINAEIRQFALDTRRQRVFENLRNSK